MKRTKNMIYKRTAESEELYIYATNNGYLYHSSIIPAINNLARKMKKGFYNSDRATDLWYYIATAASDLYKKEFGYSFTVQDRFTAAVELEKRFIEDVEEKANETKTKSA